ncbi:MAG: type II toxin-antitoxin system RelE/ParE family toxin [Candidatus Micrarchaeota archaeon]|nr:type II toxin-antitoxin system RelE/ParE family toxin [Candidatus Micrarchaeota archaeon]
MSYSVIYDNKALDFLAGLPESIRKRIFDKIADSKDNPRHFFERLSGRADYKLRIGDYRAIADINEAEERIEITYIEHRKKVYKKIG